MTRSVVIAVACILLSVRAGAQPPVDALARDVERAEAVRAVKTLQRTYAQYSQYGLWNEMAALFADDGQLTIGDDVAAGRGAIAGWFTTHGGGRQGLAPGAIHTQLIDGPVVNLSADGRTAKGRWYGFFLNADGAGHASVDGGMFENEYAVQNGVWKIRALHFLPAVHRRRTRPGGRTGRGGNRPIIPYHFNADESGMPIRRPAGAAPASSVARSPISSAASQ
jgi:hypothetical protein